MAQFNTFSYVETGSTTITAIVKKETEKAILLDVTFWTTLNTAEKHGDIWAPKKCVKDNGDGTFDITWNKILNDFIDKLNSNKGFYQKLNPNFDMKSYYSQKEFEANEKIRVKELTKNIKKTIKDTLKSTLEELVIKNFVQNLFTETKMFQLLIEYNSTHNILPVDFITKCNNIIEYISNIISLPDFKKYTHTLATPDCLNDWWFLKKLEENNVNPLVSMQNWLDCFVVESSGNMNSLIHFSLQEGGEKINLNKTLEKIKGDISSELNIKTRADYEIFNYEISNAFYYNMEKIVSSKCSKLFNNYMINYLKEFGSFIGYTSETLESYINYYTNKL